MKSFAILALMIMSVSAFGQTAADPCTFSSPCFFKWQVPAGDVGVKGFNLKLDTTVINVGLPTPTLIPAVGATPAQNSYTSPVPATTRGAHTITVQSCDTAGGTSCAAFATATPFTSDLSVPTGLSVTKTP